MSLYVTIQEKQVLLNFTAIYNIRVRRLHVQQHLLVQTRLPNCLIDIVLNYSNPTQLSVVQIACNKFRKVVANNKRLLLDQINHDLQQGLFTSSRRVVDNDIATLIELSENEQWSLSPGTLLAVTSPINHTQRLPDFIYHYTVFGSHYGAEFITPLSVKCADQAKPEYKLLDYDCDYYSTKTNPCCVIQ